MSGVKLSSASINTGGQNRIQLKDLFDTIEFGSEPKTLRPVGDIFALATHWFEINKKDGGTARLGFTCRNTNLDGTANPKGGCGFCKVSHNARPGYFQNFIDTEEEENAPRNIGKPTPEEKKSGFKMKGSKLWTPCAVLPFPPTVAATMQGITKKNKDKEGAVRELSDKSFGRALDIFKDGRKGVAAANIWSVQKADNMMRKLTPAQREYWLWDLSLLAKLMPTAKESEAEMKKLVPVMVDEDFEKLDLTDYPELAAKRKGGSKKKKSKSGSFEVEDDEDDRPKKKRRVVDDDDDEDEIPRRRRSRDDDDNDDDEDEIPKRKKSTKDKKKKKRSFDPSEIL